MKRQVATLEFILMKAEELAKADGVELDEGHLIAATGFALDLIAQVIGVSFEREVVRPGDEQTKPDPNAN